MEYNVNEQELPRSFFGRVKRRGAWIRRTACRDKAITAVVLGFVVGFMLKFTVTLSGLHKYAIRYTGELLMGALHVLTTPLIITGVIAGKPQYNMHTAFIRNILVVWQVEAYSNKISLKGIILDEHQPLWTPLTTT
ncbi:hypothetical protein EYF80_048231 [Liparis tanakae]|uniref:Uncharacterized protein n=1 Tax=Liparis tanakae TaxID=230148 RepID=A0A4Z2FKC9_9TELE|nr:hypothetical protein EYF80_048231 [Liparis tanakae]